LQAVLSLASVTAVVWTFRRSRDPDLSNALLVTATFVVTPYAFNYDMVAFGWVIVKLMDRMDNNAWDHGLMLAVWATPFATVALGIAGLPMSVLPMLGMGARLLWRIANLQAHPRPQLQKTLLPQFTAAS
jgi:hypothetical protein